MFLIYRFVTKRNRLGNRTFLTDEFESNMFPFNGQTGLWCIEKAAEKYVEEIRLQWVLYMTLCHS